MRQIEILAPAGSFESMRAAYNAGADAVYMGGRNFGARAYAENPDDEGILRAVDYANIHNKKLYLTLNTLVKEHETEAAVEFLRPLYEHGLNAVLVQDMGIFNIIKNEFPLLPVHASTQMTICGTEGVEFLKELGARRVVLSRELSLDEIREIKGKTGIEIEVFVHGALCYCYSGQCLYSSMLGGRSGNRGRCAQPCRLNYDIFGDGRRLNPRDEQAIMSLKDICALEDIPKLCAAGVDSFKIEGRMKSPEYAALSSYLYRKYTDIYLEKGPKGFKISDKDKDAILGLYNRSGYSHGYLNRHNGRDMITLGSAAYDSKGGNAYDIKSLWLDKDMKEEIKADITLEVGAPAELTLYSGDISATVTGEVVSEALSRASDKETVLKQLSKTGGTPYELKSLNADIGEKSFISIKGLNQLRRDGIDSLTEEILKAYKRVGVKYEISSLRYKEAADTSSFITIQVSDRELLENVENFGELKRIYVEEEAFTSSDGHIADRIHNMGGELYIALPYIMRNDTIKRIREKLESLKELEIDGWLIRNVESLQLIKSMDMEGAVKCDAQLYTWNSFSMGFFKEQGVSSFTAPLEENYKELLARGFSDSELIGYGYMPLMFSAQCFLKTEGCCHRECKDPVRSIYIKDRMNKKFMVKADCIDCMNVIYNSAPVSLLDCGEDIKALKPESVRLSFTNESLEDAVKVYDAFMLMIKGEAPELEIKDFTRGHLKRGVE